MTAFFFFHKSLNDFLPAMKRNSWISHNFKDIQSVKDAIEAIGVPHPEVDVIIAQNSSVGFNYRLQENDRIEVYPVLDDHIFPESYSLSRQYLQLDKFVLDVHLGKLAKAMRLLGLDTVIENHFTDNMIAQLSETENRITLTRDIGLLKHKAIKSGYWIRSQHWEEQLTEVIARYSLETKFKPFSRCTICNGMIKTVPKETVLHQLPPVSKQLFNEFFQCTNCKRVYWKGSHYDRMEKWVHKWNT